MTGKIPVIGDGSTFDYIFRIFMEQGFHDPVNEVSPEFFGGTPRQFTGQVINGHYGNK
jgi:hypothetical protein